MKYIVILIFYVMAGFWHLLDVIFRTIFNIFIFMWDFKIKDKKFFSYKTIFMPDKYKNEQCPVKDYYSIKKQFG